MSDVQKGSAGITEYIVSCPLHWNVPVVPTACAFHLYDYHIVLVLELPYTPYCMKTVITFFLTFLEADNVPINYDHKDNSKNLLFLFH